MVAEEESILFEEELRAAYDNALAQYEIDDYRFRRGVRETIHRIQALYTYAPTIVMLHDAAGQLVPLPSTGPFPDTGFLRDIEADLEKRLKAGRVRVDFEEEASGLVEVHIIPLNRSIRPKKPKNPFAKIDVFEPKRKILTPEEMAAQRAKEALMQKETRRIREALLADMRAKYGEESVQYYLKHVVRWK